MVRPFYQIHNETNRPYEGTGLGLSIVKSLAELHDATLKIDLVFGEGTSAALELPRHTVKAWSGGDPTRQVAL